MTLLNHFRAFCVLICAFQYLLGKCLWFHYICKEPGWNFNTPSPFVGGVLFSIVCLVVDVGKSHLFKDACLGYCASFFIGTKSENILKSFKN